MKLWLVRHARPLVDAGVCYGSSDMEADAQHTRNCAERLAQALPRDLPVWHSPLRRCTQLIADLHALRLDVRLRREDSLAEMDFGCWEGQRWDAIPRSAFAAWEQAFGTHRFGGRESVDDLLRRVAAARAAAVRQGRDMAWITHAGVIHAMQLLSQGVTRLEHADQWPRQTLDFGQWQLVEL